MQSRTHTIWILRAAVCPAVIILQTFASQVSPLPCADEILASDAGMDLCVKRDVSRIQPSSSKTRA
jgi:hypothetical protein